MVTRAVLCCLMLLGLSAHAQYILPYDTLKAPEDSLEKDSTVDSTGLIVPDTVDVLEEAPVLDTNYVKPAPSSGPGEPHAASIKRATAWVRHLLYRGWLDTSHIGAYARYQLTAWSHATGSYGPIDAQVTVYYLGPTEWMGKDAEWLQIAMQTMDEDPVLLEYDVLVPSKQKVDEVYRVLYRVDRGAVKPGSLAVPESEVDYDRQDDPISEGLGDLEFHSGIFQAEVFHGAGNDGSDVYIYRADKMPPLSIVALGYGEEGLTFVSSGSDASPRFYVPPPPAAH